jgi:hypothetical protein
MRMPARDAQQTMRFPSAADTQRAVPGGPIELPPGTWEAPPVRQGSGASITSPEVPASPEPALTPEERARRRARRLIIAMALAVGTLVGGGIWLVQYVVGRVEAGRYDTAREAFDNNNFVEAAAKFRDLEEGYPSSNRVDEYRFYAQWSEARQPAYTQVSPRATLTGFDRFLAFVKRHQQNEWLRKAEIKDTLYKFAAQLTEWSERDNSPDLAARAREALEKARDYADGKEDERDQALAARLEKVAGVVKTQTARRRLVDRLKELARAPSAATFRQARSEVRQAEDEDPGLADDPDINQCLDQLVGAHRRQVRYTTARRRPPFRGPAEDSEPSLLVAPPVGGLGFKPWPRQSPVLALARGVLYALAPSNGRVRWAVRVGIDTTVLPVRIPARQATPELILVLSSDSNTLSALDAARGDALWHHRLSAPCLGQPTVAGRRIIVPCYNGRVDEVNLATGAMVGSFRLRQPLSRGGVYDEDNGLYYLAADSDCVYVLDFNRRRCAAILYTDHPSGSIRSRPILVHWKDTPAEGPAGNGPRSCLILCQAAGLEATELRLFSLPATRADASPLKLKLRLQGWSWFAPRHDSEKLALATDAGEVGVYGIRQKNNRDPFLYPMLDRPVVLEPSERAAGQPSGRAELIHLDESNFWVLVHGELHRLQLALGPGGWKMTPVWLNPILVGAPLHAGQVDVDRGLLFLVTQPGREPVCLASGIWAEATGEDQDKVRWQTQLGLAAPEEPVSLPGAVLVQDARGGLFRFATDKYKDTDVAWHIHEKLEARPPADEGSRGVRLLGTSGGAFALVQGKGGPATLVVRHFDRANNQVKAYPCPLAAPLNGTPGVWPDHLVLPLGDGVLVRKDIPGSAPVAGLNWRAEQADASAQGHVVPLGGDDFLVTDGSRDLIQMTWPKNGANVQKTKTTLPARIVAAPVVRFSSTGKPFIYVADADNGLTVLGGGLDAAPVREVLDVQREGRITAGPFDLGRGIGLVLDGRRLIVLNGETLKPLWTYTASADLVGRPVVLGGRIILGDSEGGFVGLDPATGKAQGPGYQLRATVAPACTAAPFDTDRLFIPLTDGTVLLLPLKRFQEGGAPKPVVPERYL